MDARSRRGHGAGASDARRTNVPALRRLQPRPVRARRAPGVGAQRGFGRRYAARGDRARRRLLRRESFHPRVSPPLRRNAWKLSPRTQESGSAHVIFRLAALVAVPMLLAACGKDGNPFASFETRCARLPPTRFAVVTTPFTRSEERRVGK